MRVLALDTATTELVAGLANVSGGVDVIAEKIISTRAHNELLVPTIAELLEGAGLAFSDLEAIVVGCGPGPFTGLRVGMATAQALGQALGIPVYGVVTHDAVAKGVDAESALIVTDARRREVYWARYENGQRVAGPDVVKPAKLDCPPVVFCSVPEQLAAQLSVDADEVTYLPPRTAGLVAAADFSAPPAPLVPHYLRRPDAVPPKQKPRSPALPDIDLKKLS
ncbi:tRNA (adenosine(37)-N6)-threonylcarbamoyltransferase complex dimerization subunit type 1 TsaB [Corynebacterium imitans]|uniref:tRNA (adenosine(37)-N6)-threonylcarbamoyltransferase complex dimerization subunit type 1 TsaB n=1 Tax=Corynebacterium imitans TaxID=156978 RepID=UPI00254ACD7B|nr:tRNA (adenosine(37)-N6)-threonylcarbamoyltransferase complex dimerization subunit type 1 TsaB [Corynebacterium imitans]MDK8306298.1 tRNA (adenosine(37)-N6)-threonylcarbamoyltransferase complex dimerization subunit type 1 TsaB [Corynebacterium imitans]MDK8637657.1 tRNA (adenosine(37)-N6)-threonylcarbamoyltransferase complex dimerization subunit type 1 TsaB [Corynebacterium imitans]MDK8772823.1 tRNA (adenosine(37)-N6)-threonylcarbamoyltransferase complex dimerization subunit type 1 TsaB [Coryne